MLTFCTRLVLLCLLVAGCQSPFLLFPGKTLEGEVSYADSFQFADKYDLLQLEVNDYSVILRTTVIEGNLYVDAAPGRRWAKHLQQTDRVRVKLGNQIYPATAEVVTDPALTQRFLSGRTLYRISPEKAP